MSGSKCRLRWMSLTHIMLQMSASRFGLRTSDFDCNASGSIQISDVDFYARWFLDLALWVSGFISIRNLRLQTSLSTPEAV